MAKTALYAKIKSDLKALKATYNDMNDRIRCQMDVGEPLRAKLAKQWFELATATADMTAHLDNLKRREEKPTVTDKLRNLKNIFKDKAQLSAARADIQAKFEKLKPKIETLKNASKAI